MNLEWNHKQSIKEMLRHAGFKLGAERLMRRYRQKLGHVVAHLDNMSSAARFGAIYKTSAWVVNIGKQESLSGLGSEAEAAAHLQSALPSLLSRLRCSTLLDVGCGDWNWMRNMHLPCDYIGLDIVPEVIEANRRYERPGVSFKVLDGVTGPLPRSDVALCREVLFHLSFSDGCAVLANICKAARWLIATTDPTIWFNSDVLTGDFRKINLQRSPYCLPLPIEVVLDDAVSRGRVLGVWEVEDLPGRYHAGASNDSDA